MKKSLLRGKELINTTVFEAAILAKVPVFYRYMNRMTGKQLSSIEFGAVKRSTSRKHRSRTYFLYGPYKPYSKFISHKWKF